MDSSLLRLEAPAPSQAALLDCCFQSESVAFTAASDGSITRFVLVLVGTPKPSFSFNFVFISDTTCFIFLYSNINQFILFITSDSIIASNTMIITCLIFCISVAYGASFWYTLLASSFSDLAIRLGFCLFGLICSIMLCLQWFYWREYVWIITVCFS